jgi:hypothetical protein
VLIQEKISKLAGTIGRQQAPLFIVHLKYRSDRLNEAYQSGLKTLADATGGSAVFCRSNTEIGEAVRRTLGTLTRHHTLTVAVPPDLRNSVRVQVALPGGRGISYRSRLELVTQ